jgi:hypothetical protein
MNMPRFTAEVSLYKTNGHYQTSRQAINGSALMMGAIHLTAMDVPGEDIFVVGEAPWFPPSWGGHTGSGGTPGGGGGGSDGGTGEPGGGDGGTVPSEKPPIDKDIPLPDMRGCSHNRLLPN